MQSTPAIKLPDRLAGKKLVFQGKFFMSAGVFSWAADEWLRQLVHAQQGTVCDELDEAIDYLVIPDLNGQKTAQRKAAALNKKGASIQVLDMAGLRAIAEPTADDLTAALRAGDADLVQALHVETFHHWVGLKSTALFLMSSRDLSGMFLEGVHLSSIRFENCCFQGARLENVIIDEATACDFSDSRGIDLKIINMEKCCFRKAEFTGGYLQGDLAGSDLSEGSFESVVFSARQAQAPLLSVAGACFPRARLRAARFYGGPLLSPDFQGADLTQASFNAMAIHSGNFRGAILRGVLLAECKLLGCDFQDADLRGANLAGADLTGSNLSGARLEHAHLRGAALGPVELSTAQHLDPDRLAPISAGPALRDLDTAGANASRLKIVFQVRSAADRQHETLAYDSQGTFVAPGVGSPRIDGPNGMIHHGLKGCADALIKLATLAGHLSVAFETVEVKVENSAQRGNALRDLAVQAIAEVFAQPVPRAAELAAARKALREQKREKTAAERQARAQAIQAAEQARALREREAEDELARSLGKVVDVHTFLQMLAVRIEKPKIDRATKMLQASGFRLFHDITPEQVTGVVKSQSDPDLVYACRLKSDGTYACCTQNLSVCGGLRGALCKHLLVLLIGLVQAGELNPSVIDGWVARTRGLRSKLDAEAMSEVFLKYKGAEAGEIDWRPTETTPEDYYMA